MKNETLVIKAEELLLVSVEPAGFEFILRPRDCVRFISSEPPQLEENGLERAVYLPSGEFSMELNGQQLEETPTMRPLDIVELELARLPKATRPRAIPESLATQAQATEFRIEFGLKNQIEILENVAQFSVELANSFPAKKPVFMMMENICVRLLAIGAIQVDYRIDDFGKQLHDVGRTDRALGGQPNSTRRLLAASCKYPESLTEEVQKWCKLAAEDSEESPEMRNG